MNKKLCPNCGNDTFYVAAIERHTWIVDGYENFIADESVDECEIAENTEWTCEECGDVYDSPKDLVSVFPPEEEYDGPLPDEYDDPKASFERMSEYELRHP